MDNRLIFLGTGNAMVTRCFNTCFILESGGKRLMVDAGGGNGILRQMEDAGISFTSIHDLYLTHAHTDHVMGGVWVVRKVTSLMSQGKYDGVLRIYGHEKVLRVLLTMCELMLPRKFFTMIGERVEMVEVHDGEHFEAAGMQLVAFDIHSTKEKQYGFTATLPDGTRVACLGDEPFNAQCRCHVADADWLLSEAFCLYDAREVFKPYEKHHSTALDAGRLAKELNVRHLVMYHTEDKTLATRKKAYSEEAAKEFDGEVFVPDDLEVIFF
jgi:ribonuclease Z